MAVSRARVRCGAQGGIIEPKQELTLRERCRWSAAALTAALVLAAGFSAAAASAVSSGGPDRLQEAGATPPAQPASFSSQKPGAEKRKTKRRRPKVRRPVAALGRRAIPVGVANVNNQVLTSSRYVYAIRFVLDRPTTLHRFFSGFVLEGTSRLGGRPRYAHGDGGTILARLVQVDREGRPDLGRVLASERVNGVDRYLETAGAYGILPHRTVLLHFNMGGVKLKRGRMYAMTYQNVSGQPQQNWFSTNSPVVKASEAGPNGRNNLNPDARGAIMGLDPREAVGWSTDAGKGWVWGRRVGEGPARFSYAGSPSSDEGARLPWYGWQATPTSPPRSNQPYYAYRQAGSYELIVSGAPRATTLTEAGGYAPVGRSAGTVTVTNLRTGVTGSTPYLGSGIVKGALSQPVPIAVGDSYLISNSGTVFKAEGDFFLVRIFNVGTNRFPYLTLGHNVDRAELFALPHPFYKPVGP